MAEKNYIRLFKEFKANQQIFRVLESSKALTDGIFDELPTALIMIDHSERILKMNHAAEGLYGAVEKDFLGQQIQRLWPGGLTPKFMDYLGSAKTVGVSIPRGFEQAIQVGDIAHHIYWQVCPVYTDRSGSSVLALIGNDITDAKRALELHKDLEIAKAVQSTLIPPTNFVSTPTCDLYVHYEPAALVSGDLWWYLESEDCLLTFVVDVMGHGAGAAMVTAIITGALCSYTNTKTIQSVEDVIGLCHHLNDVLCKALRYETMAVGTAVLVNFNTKEMTVFGMGMPGAVRIFSDGTTQSVIARGSPLGLPDTPMKVGHSTFALQKKERVFVFTDGCYEFETKNGQGLGRAQFAKQLATTFSLKSTEICEVVATRLRDLRDRPIPEDDITFAVFCENSK